MKKLFLFLLSLFVSFSVNAQLQVKDGSFKEVLGFININNDPNYQIDDNNVAFSVIKVRTENIDDKQRRELLFESNGGVCINLEYKIGEIWVYITSRYSRYLKISHPDLSSTEFIIPCDLQPKMGYELTLLNSSINTPSGSGGLTVITKPEGASISLNGQVVKNQTTPYYNNWIAVGRYEITVSKDRYKTVTMTVFILNNDEKTVNIELPEDNVECVSKPACGSIGVVSNLSGATVYIDNKKCGVTPIANLDLTIGTHNLRIEKQGHATINKTINLEARKKIVVKTIFK